MGQQWKLRIECPLEAQTIIPERESDACAKTILMSDCWKSNHFQAHRGPATPLAGQLLNVI